MSRLAVLLILLSVLSPAAEPPDLTRVVPFGEPLTLRTAVLRSTALVLHPDEELRSIALADAERWQVEWGAYGPADRPTPVVTVTPTDCGLTTSLLVMTTRRLYPVLLDAASCDFAGSTNPSYPYDAVVRFRYPEPLVTQVPLRPKQEPEVSDKPRHTFGAPLEELLQQAATYKVSARKRYRGPWPMLVTDDGAITYLIFREGAFDRDGAPLLFLVDAEGEVQLADYQVDGAVLRVPALFEEAILLTEGDPTRRRTPRLVIERR